MNGWKCKNLFLSVMVRKHEKDGIARLLHENHLLNTEHSETTKHCMVRESQRICSYNTHTHTHTHTHTEREREREREREEGLERK